MNEANAYFFMQGALVAASALAGLFFLRFWRNMGDRLFLAFAAAFLLLAVNWLLLAIFPEQSESRPLFYLLRLAAFLILLLGILDKNRSARR